MKKTLITVFAVAMLVAVFGGVGSAYAMEDAGKGPGNGGGGNGTGTATAGSNGTSVLSPYMADAAASALNLDPAEVADRLAAGETFYDIALSMGYTAEFIPEFLDSVQTAAAEAAAVDGLVPQTQLNTQLNTNLGTQSQLNDGTCDGTGDCVSDPTLNLYSGSNSGTRGRRGGR